MASHGPADPKKHQELTRLFQGSTAGLVYVAAFPNKSAMVKYVSNISWDTEARIANNPSHLIHFYGKRL
ncbi:MAG: hypothetical protein KDD02_11610 [Phaeodactylibacter sp.]|nr:hypothetical protein [Phaeodactylibacter sp.]